MAVRTAVAGRSTARVPDNREHCAGRRNRATNGTQSVATGHRSAAPSSLSRCSVRYDRKTDQPLRPRRNCARRSSALLRRSHKHCRPPRVCRRRFTSCADVKQESIPAAVFAVWRTLPSDQPSMPGLGLDRWFRRLQLIAFAKKLPDAFVAPRLPPCQRLYSRRFIISS